MTSGCELLYRYLFWFYYFQLSTTFVLYSFSIAPVIREIAHVTFVRSLPWPSKIAETFITLNCLQLSLYKFAESGPFDFELDQHHSPPSPLPVFIVAAGKINYNKTKVVQLNIMKDLRRSSHKLPDYPDIRLSHLSRSYWLPMDWSSLIRE